MSYYTEVWARPGAATFGRVIDEAPNEYQSFHDGFNILGDGSMQIPNTFDRFDEILAIDPNTPANTYQGLFRVFDDSDPTTPIFEWLPDSILPTTTKGDPNVSVNGRGIKSILGRALIEPFDWDGSIDWACVDCDWVYGSSVSLLRNGGFEDGSAPNGGFELGNTNYWQTTESDGFLTNAQSITAVENSSEAQAGDWYGLVNPGANSNTGAMRSFSGLVPGDTYSLVGYMLDPTSSGDRWRAGVGKVADATHTNAYEEDNYWWAEVDNATQGNGASDGTWQSFTLTFVALESTIQLVVVYTDTGPGPNFRTDSWTLTGDDVGLAPWEARASQDLIDIFEVSTTNVQAGSQSARFQGRAQVDPGGLYPGDGFTFPGVYQAVNMEVGKTYTFSIWAYHESGSDEEFGVSIRRQSLTSNDPDRGDSIMANARFTVPSGVYTKMTVTGVSDVTAAAVRANWIYTGALDSSAHQSPVIWFDSAILAQGLPATTAGAILGDLYADATSDHSGRIVWEDEANPGTAYLTLDFDDDVDSGGVAWAHSEIQLRLWQRMTYLQVMEQFALTYGYEWRIVADDVENGTWLWQVYNPGTMKTDYTSAASPAIQGGSSDVTRQILRVLPSGTSAFVEGEGRVTSRYTDTTLETALGRIESGRIDRQLPSLDAAADAAYADANDFLVDGLAYGYDLVNPQDLPLVAYQIGDLLTVHDPPIVEDSARLIDVEVVMLPQRTIIGVQFSPATAAGS